MKLAMIMSVRRILEFFGFRDIEIVGKNEAVRRMLAKGDGVAVFSVERQ